MAPELWEGDGVEPGCSACLGNVSLGACPFLAAWPIEVCSSFKRKRRDIPFFLSGYILQLLGTTLLSIRYIMTGTMDLKNCPNLVFKCRVTQQYQSASHSKALTCEWTLL